MTELDFTPAQAGASQGLTTRQGHPVQDNQNLRTIGSRGPATLEDYAFIEKISHLDRERIPERVVHARRFVAHGELEAYGTIGDKASVYTRARLFQEKGTTTPVSVRFSTAGGPSGPSEAARDPRGLAVTFRTQDGNRDLVGNDLLVFFIPDATKFPDLIHSQKPDPRTDKQEPQRVFDVISMTPESMHMVSFLFSEKGIPKDCMHMNGGGVNTYKMVDAQGATVLVKYRWTSQQGDVGLTQDEADAVPSTDVGHATAATFEAIERGEFPRWELGVQVMSDGEHPELDVDPLDDTKVWPEDRFPVRPVGMMMLNKDVVDFHQENEQIAFGTGVLVDGLEFSDDRMLLGRTFSYSDTQRYRVGPNYLQLPVNRPVVPVATDQRGGPMSYGVDLTGSDPHVTYEPSTAGGLSEHPRTSIPDSPHDDARKVQQTLEKENNDGQVRERYDMDDAQRAELHSNLIGALSQCTDAVKQRMVGHLLRVDEGYGTTVGQGIGVDLDEAHKAVEEVDRFWAERGRPHAGALPEAFVSA
jgi:catalase